MRHLPILLLLLNCCATDPFVIQRIVRQCVIDVVPFFYDITLDAEATDERILKCLDSSTVEVPSFKKITEGEAVMVDCPESGILMTLEDYVKMQECTIDGIALINSGPA